VVPPTTLQQSKLCRSQVPIQYSAMATNNPLAGISAPPITIEMNNDGGWCAFNLSTLGGGRSFPADVRITRAPAHGQVATAKLQQTTEVAYKPDTGFAGADGFSVVNQTLGMVRPVSVTVTQ
jgi:hypothetical protein